MFGLSSLCIKNKLKAESHKEMGSCNPTILFVWLLEFPKPLSFGWNGIGFFGFFGLFGLFSLFKFNPLGWKGVTMGDWK